MSRFLLATTFLVLGVFALFIVAACWGAGSGPLVLKSAVLLIGSGAAIGLVLGHEL